MKLKKRFIALLSFILFFSPTIPLIPRVRAGRLKKIEKAVGKSKSTSGSYTPGAPVTTYNYSRYDYSSPSYSSSSGGRRSYTNGPAEISEFRGKSYSIVSGFHYLYDTKGDLDGFTGLLRWRTHYGGLEGDFTRFREQVETGNDYLNLYYCNIFTTLIGKRFILDTGFGYTGIDGEEQFSGFGIACNLNVYPLNPFVLNLNGKGSLVHHTFIGDFRAAIGIVYAFVELRIGFRYLAVENAPGIQGPVFGINLNF